VKDGIYPLYRALQFAVIPHIPFDEFHFLIQIIGDISFRMDLRLQAIEYPNGIPPLHQPINEI
jgi:hypothetical protein